MSKVWLLLLVLVVVEGEMACPVTGKKERGYSRGHMHDVARGIDGDE